MESAKMRIVLAVTLGEPGGVQQFLAGFGAFLKSLGHEVTVVSGDGDWLKLRCEALGLPYIRLQKMGREISPLRDLPAIAELKRIFTELKPDAVHLNSAKMGAVGSIAASLAKVPHVTYRIGGWTFREELPASKKWLYRRIEISTARFKDVIVCVHPGDEAIAREAGIKPRKRLVTVANGIDLAAFDKNLIARDIARQILLACNGKNVCEPGAHAPDEKTFLFGTVANFYPPKDLSRYLDACKLVHNAEPASRFLILGDGKLRPELEAKRKTLGLEDAVWLPGARDDASHLLAGFDAFVLPSSKEGMAFALLEAMAAKLPCL
ncbi:MAG TPA: glycosyltransferase, partial [Verrucomicrobiae bacterium]|nr:glycosyltransferase [Verrucomicrobiae bacterium]